MIHLHFTYTKDDYVPALRTYLVRKPKFFALFIFVYLLSISLLMLLLGGSTYSNTSWLTVCSIVALLGLIGMLLFALPHQKFQHSYKAVDEYWFHIADQGIIFETEHETGVLPWRRCTKLLETKTSFIFEHDHRRITVIPKRAFKNKTEEHAFREILKSKLTPALSRKLLKVKEPEPGEDYVPPEKIPDWR